MVRYGTEERFGRIPPPVRVTPRPYAACVTDDEALDAARTLLGAAAQRLRAAGAPDEALAVFEPARKRLGITLKPRMKPIGRVWRLGVLLVEPDGGVRATGGITRAVPPGHVRYAAVSIEARREVRAAAHRGPFREGETIDYDAPRILLTPDALRTTPGPLLLADGGVRVRWSVSAGDDAARPLGAYLDERVELLLHPPLGA